MNKKRQVPASAQSPASPLASGPSSSLPASRDEGPEEETIAPVEKETLGKDKAAAGNDAGTSEQPPFLSGINKDNILQGIILSEVLGRPRSKRRGRW